MDDDRCKSDSNETQWLKVKVSVWKEKPDFSADGARTGLVKQAAMGHDPPGRWIGRCR